MRSIIIPVFLTLSLLPGLAFAECSLDPKLLGARYTVTTAGEEKVQELALWRKHSRVLWENPQSGIAESWSRSGGEQLQLVRYYDQYERGIEYYAADMKSDAARSWARLWQIVSPAERDALTAQAASGEGCERVQAYAGNVSGRETSLEWLLTAQLPSRWEFSQNGQRRTYALKELITDAHVVEQAFKHRDAYQLIDYADIGDNESDPFLAKVMSAGHGHTGTHSSGAAHGGHGH